MTVIRTRRTGTFRAIDDAGKEYVIHIMTEFIDTSTLSGNSETEGVKNFVLDDGRNVNRVEQGRYEVVQTGQILTSDAPNAP